MKKIYFTPGPTELYPAVHDAVRDALDNHVCSINHRSSEFNEIYKSADSGLRQLMGIPDGHRILFLSSATECMDRLIQNCVEKNSHHFVNGAFAERFYRTSTELGRNATVTMAEHGCGFDFDGGLSFPEAEMICVTQNETSSGVAVPMQNIYKLKQTNPDALLAVDIVTSAPYILPDFSMIDAAFFSVQKGFGMPAGLGVLIANERTLERARTLKVRGTNIGSFHNLPTLFEYAEKFQNPETPNVLGIYLLGRVCEHLNEYGAERMRTETEEKAAELYNAIENCANLEPLVKNPADRSMTIIIADAGEKQREIKAELLNNGYVVGSGYGKFKEREIRIANFPMHKLEDVSAISEILNKRT